MKIRHEHYRHIQQEIKRVWTPTSHEIQRQHIIYEGKAKDVEKRLRWDWLYMAVSSHWLCDNIYAYADDAHIDTALRSIIKELESRA